MARLTAKTFKKYLDEVSETASGALAFTKCIKKLRDKEIFPRRDLIQMLKNPKQATVHQRHEMLKKLYYSNAHFMENASFSEKREVRDGFTDGKHSKAVDNKAAKKYLSGQRLIVREDMVREVDDFGERAYRDRETKLLYPHPSVSTILEVGEPFDRTNWYNIERGKAANTHLNDGEIWQLMDQKSEWGASRGSMMHELVEGYLADRYFFERNHNFSEEHPLVMKCFNKLLPYLKYEIDETILMETFCVLPLEKVTGVKDSGVLGYPDHIGTKDGRIILNDWKSALKRKQWQYTKRYRWQVSAYCAMVFHMYGIKVDEARIVIAPENGNLQVFTLSREDIKYNLQEFLKHCRTYYLQKEVLEKAA